MSVTYGETTLNIIEAINPTPKPHRGKQTIGKRCAMHEVLDSSQNDTVLEISGRLKETSAALLNTAKIALAALADGQQHEYSDSSDSSYDGQYVIETGSLTFTRHINPLTIIFNFRLIEW